MSTTFIDTNKLAREAGPAGDVTEVLNEQLAGAKSVKGMLRWLKDGQTFNAGGAEQHLIYFMEGHAKVSLQGKDYDVKKGNGVFLEPSETATITGDAKLFHLVVPVSSAA